MLMSLIESLSGETRNSIGITRLAEPVQRLSSLINLISKRHLHGILFIMHHVINLRRNEH